jgi:hypothetical protein
VVEADGTIPTLLVEAGGATRPIPFDDRLALETRGSVSAA